MRPRLLRRCLLFALLGLVTAVVVAWAVAANWQLRSMRYTARGLGVAQVNDVVASVVVEYGLGFRRESWMAERASWRFPEIQGLSCYRGIILDELNSWGSGQPLVTRNLDSLAQKGPPFPQPRLGWQFTTYRTSIGWPWQALSYSTQLDSRAAQPVESVLAMGGALDGGLPSAIAVTSPWATRLSRAGNGALMLPLKPLPGLVLNTIFYAALWAILLLAPGALRRRIRRARGRCPACGYSLRGQPAPGCPECGQGRSGTLPPAVD